MSSDNKEKPKTIQLFCPSVSKLIRFVAWDSQKLDIGSISRMFGLDPLTVKLNGHFISRGVDLVSSSVTWRSLLSFFSSKGLCIGTDGHKGALIVDGKLCKVGSKRAHEPQDCVSWSRDSAGKPGINDVGLTAKLQRKDIYLFENKKLRESSLTGKIQTTLFKNNGELAWLKQLIRLGIQDPMMEVIVQFPKSILGLASKDSVR
uniref:Uncharacterized protein n=1 Tax=Gossypium raimondii TaxID=29730 RepID=A0A0D2TFQ7_GOSRA|nr:hypothetical protein B456_007G155900 [Gossypium raimondii]